MSLSVAASETDSELREAWAENMTIESSLILDPFRISKRDVGSGSDGVQFISILNLHVNSLPILQIGICRYGKTPVPRDEVQGLRCMP